MTTKAVYFPFIGHFSTSAKWWIFLVTFIWLVCRLHFFGTMTKIYMYRTTKKQYLSLKWSSGCLKIICKELKLQLMATWKERNISVFPYRPIFGHLPSDKSINRPWDYAYSVFTLAVLGRKLFSYRYTRFSTSLSVFHQQARFPIFAFRLGEKAREYGIGHNVPWSFKPHTCCFIRNLWSTCFSQCQPVFLPWKRQQS